MIEDTLLVTRDEVLANLLTQEGPRADLVRAFLDEHGTDGSNWLDLWFRTRVTRLFSGSLSGSEENFTVTSPVEELPSPPSAQSVKLKSVHPCHFRGFREVSKAIDMSGEFIVVEGRNSSGKTSLAEALEWLFTGTLSRREGVSSGNSRELESCITNQFRPEEAQTWVSATFVVHDIGDEPKEIRIRRVLEQDYGTTSTSTCSSALFVGDQQLDRAGERKVLDRLFGGVPPLLMQHTLREFVEGDPKRRRDYFERLLRLDGLTTLIGQAVITDERAVDFPSPSGNRHFDSLTTLSSYFQTEQAKRIPNRILQGSQGQTTDNISEGLSVVCHSEFTDQLEGLDRQDQIVAAFEEEQLRVRQSSFPLLAELRPTKELADDSLERIAQADIGELSDHIRHAWGTYEPAMLAVQAIGRDNLAVSKAFQVLSDAGIVELSPASQRCPVCSFEQVDSLTAERIEVIRSWAPIVQNELTAKRIMAERMNSLKTVIKDRLEGYRQLLPNPPDEAKWEEALDGAGDRLRGVVNNLRAVVEARKDLELAVKAAREFIDTDISVPTKVDECEHFIDECVGLIHGVTDIPNKAKEYREAFLVIEAVVGAEARSDPKYRLREGLIACFANVGGILEDVKWERAKRHAQRDLEQIRESLITYRQQFLESQTESFNTNIDSVWKALRKETFAAFKHLHIPRPRGRGFPIEIQLKALLDDSQSNLEVDVLKVFSESQVNALGIAAFVTRAKLLGHRMLILDDPVQSMDEEHFKTFARDLIPEILDEGFQLVLLTHNDTFARDVSNYHHDREDYVTMSIRHSRRNGSVVEEGNRRVYERLKMAERHLDIGDLERAWTYIRLGIERLYTISFIKYGPKTFEPSTWQHQTADYMWNHGARETILAKLPDSEERLKEILDMTAGGAHDTPARGETDARASLNYLRGALQTLKVGG